MYLHRFKPRSVFVAFQKKPRKIKTSIINEYGPSSEKEVVEYHDTPTQAMNRYLNIKGGVNNLKSMTVVKKITEYEKTSIPEDLILELVELRKEFSMLLDNTWVSILDEKVINVFEWSYCVNTKITPWRMAENPDYSVLIKIAEKNPNIVIAKLKNNYNIVILTKDINSLAKVKLLLESKYEQTDISALVQFSIKLDKAMSS